MTLEQLISRDQLIAFCRKNNIVYLAVFGSVAAGTARPDSDLDLLVKFRETISLYEHVQIQQELEELIGRSVDLLTIEGLNHRLRDRILQSQKVIYDEAA